MAHRPTALASGYQQLNSVDTFLTGSDVDFSKPDAPDFIVYKNETKTEVKSCTIEKAVEKLTADLYYCPIGTTRALLSFFFLSGSLLSSFLS
jgi:hypothetical protein